MMSAVERTADTQKTSDKDTGDRNDKDDEDDEDRQRSKMLMAGKCVEMSHKSKEQQQ